MGEGRHPGRPGQGATAMSTSTSGAGAVRDLRTSGWLGFAGILILTLGLLHVMSGLAAFLKDDYFAVTDAGLLVWNYTAWGWIWLVVGIAQLAVGLGVLAGSEPARAAGVLLTVLALLGQAAYLAAFPLWSVVVIGTCLLVIYALVAPPRDAVAV